MKHEMDVPEIVKLLPHRYPFLMIDRVIEFVPDEFIVAIKNVTINEPFFAGHFPGIPVMPGVLILEAMAQAGGILAYKSTKTKADEGVLYYFAGIDKAKFRRIVTPGDQLRLEVKVLRAKDKIWKLYGEAFVEKDLVCSAEILSARKG